MEHDAGAPPRAISAPERGIWGRLQHPGTLLAPMQAGAPAADARRAVGVKGAGGAAGHVHQE